MPSYCSDDLDLTISLTREELVTPSWSCKSTRLEKTLWRSSLPFSFTLYIFNKVYFSLIHCERQKGAVGICQGRDKKFGGCMESPFPCSLSVAPYAYVLGMEVFLPPFSHLAFRFQPIAQPGYKGGLKPECQSSKIGYHSTTLKRNVHIQSWLFQARTIFTSCLHPQQLTQCLHKWHAIGECGLKWSRAGSHINLAAVPEP